MDLKSQGHAPDKPAGMALRDARTLVVINDNDISSKQQSFIYTIRF